MSGSRDEEGERGIDNWIKRGMGQFLAYINV